jgi:hypothetical protein
MVVTIKVKSKIKHYFLMMCGVMEVSFHHSLPRHYLELGCQLHAPASISSGYILNIGLGRLQSRSERYRKAKNLLLLSGIEPLFLGRSACSPAFTRFSS